MASLPRIDPTRPRYELFPYALVVCSVHAPAEHGQSVLAALGFTVDTEHPTEKIGLREARFVSAYQALTLSHLTLFHAIGGMRPFEIGPAGRGLLDAIVSSCEPELLLGPAQVEPVLLFRPLYVLELHEPVRERLRPPHLRIPTPSPPTPPSPPSSPPAAP